MPSHTAMGWKAPKHHTETDNMMVVVNTVLQVTLGQREEGENSLVLQSLHTNTSVTLTGGNLEKSVIRHAVWFITSTETQNVTEIHKMIHTMTRRLDIQWYSSTCSEINAKISLNFSKPVSRSQVDLKEGKQAIWRTSCYMYSGCTDFCAERKLYMFSWSKIYQNLFSLPRIIRSELTFILPEYLQCTYKV